MRNDYVDDDDMCLVRFATTVDETVDEIEHFYSNYRDFMIAGDRGVLSVNRADPESGREL